MLRPQETIADRYVILGPEPLGQGGMGKVWKARDKKVGSVVAVKEFEPDAASKISPSVRENLIGLFLKEAELLAGLEHEAFPKVRDRCETAENRPCIIMDFVSGDDFAKQLAQRRGEPFEVESLLDWLEQLLGALDYLHTRPNPVIHKDIKPDNLKLTSDGRIKVLDFGIAKGYVGEMTIVQGSVPFGTVQYAPLEQALKASDEVRKSLSENHRERVEAFLRQTTTPQTDIFSLCATVYRLLCGNKPENFDVHSRALKVWNNKPDPLENLSELNRKVPQKLSDLIKKGMSLEVADRIRSAAEMQAVLKEIKADEEDLNYEKRQNELKRRLDDEYQQKISRLNNDVEATTLRLREENLKVLEFRQRTVELEKSLQETNKNSVDKEKLLEAEKNAKVYQARLEKLQGDLPKIKEEAMTAFKNGLLESFGIKEGRVPAEYGSSAFFTRELEAARNKIAKQTDGRKNIAAAPVQFASTSGGQDTGRAYAVSSLLTIAIPLPLIITAVLAWPGITYNGNLNEAGFLFFLTALLSLAVPLFSLIILLIADVLFKIIGKGRNNRARKYMFVFCSTVFICGILGASIGITQSAAGIVRGNILGMAAGYLIFLLYFYRETMKRR